MNRLITFVLMMLATTAMAQVDVESIPDWYNNPPTSARKIYAAGTATGPTVDVAEKKATMDEKIQLARQVGQVKYLSKDGESITTEVVKAELRDVRVERKKVISTGNSHTVFVLVSMKKKNMKRES